MGREKVSLDSVVRQNGDLVTSDIDGEVVMMSIENGEYYGMDLIGSRIWELLTEPCKVSLLVDNLLKEYQVNRKTCEQDVLAFLNRLAETRVIITV